MESYSLYLHVPFCVHRCGYCDFNTYAGLESLIPAYVDALCTEVEAAVRNAGVPLSAHTIFFGGGTPSLLPPEALGQVMAVVRRSFDLDREAEISLEANPGTLTLEYLQALRGLGLNRLSLGVQSTQPEELRLLERQHRYPEVIQAVHWARQAGFENLNLDLIFGLPGQSLESWQRTVELVLGLAPEHLSLYALTVEHGTPLAHWTARGLLDEPDPDLAADMYEWAAERLALAGFRQYEISNWADEKEGHLLACRHNLQYWRGQPYLGFGAGAHGYAAGYRTANVLSPAAYIQRLQANSHPHPFPRTPATAHFQPIDRRMEIGETMMMGLRLTQEGISRTAFAARFGAAMEDVFPAEIESLINAGLLEWTADQDRLRLTTRGHLLGNQVFLRFI